MICGKLTTKNYNILMRSLIQHLQGNDTFSAMAVKDFLLTQDAESTRWPKDDEFEKAWLNRPVYDVLNRARVRIVLEALELEMYTGKTEKITFDSKLTIEHVLPQEWEAHWPLPEGIPVDEAMQRREYLLHTVGNLTLVTDRLNPAMSNGSWPRKKAALAEHTRLAMNRKLLALNEWGEAAVETRSKGLYRFGEDDLAQAGSGPGGRKSMTSDTFPGSCGPSRSATTSRQSLGASSARTGRRPDWSRSSSRRMGTCSVDATANRRLRRSLAKIGGLA